MADPKDQSLPASLLVDLARTGLATASAEGAAKIWAEGEVLREAILQMLAEGHVEFDPDPPGSFNLHVPVQVFADLVEALGEKVGYEHPVDAWERLAVRENLK